MTWTAPRSVTRIVAWLIGASALLSFAYGIWNAPGGRLPGEGSGAKSAAPTIQAMEATPLSQERIEGPPPPPELTEAEKLKLEADKKAKADAAAAAKLAEAAAAAAPTEAVTPPPVAAPPPAAPPPAQPTPEEAPF